MQEMTSGSPLKLIIKFSIPLLIGNIFQQLYSISDIIIVGRLLGETALAAIGAVAPLFFLLVVVSIGFTNGLTVITAQKFGAKDYKGIRKSVCTATVLSSLFALLMSIPILYFMDILLTIMNIPEDIFAHSKQFITMLAYGILMIVFFNLLSGLIRALGDSRTPLYFLIVTTTLNVLFNYLYIQGLKMGIAGSALGTVTAMTISVICCFIYIWLKFPLLHPQKKDWKIDKKLYKEHLAVAAPMAVQFSIIALSAAVTQRVCNGFGQTTIAAFTAALRVEQLACQPMVSLGIAMATYVAQNYGAGMIGRVRRAVFQCSMISLGLCLFLAYLSYSYNQSLIRAFLSEEKTHNIDEVVKIARTYLNISIMFYFFLGQIFIFRNALQGMGEGFIPLVSSIIELLMRGFAAVYLASEYGYIGICFASPIAWIGAFIVLSLGYQWKIKRIGKLYLYNRAMIISETSI